MAEQTMAFPMWIIAAAVVVVAMVVGFALYWYLGRGDDQQS